MKAPLTKASAPAGRHQHGAEVGSNVETDRQREAAIITDCLQGRTRHKGHSTLGWGLFYDPLAGGCAISEIRQRLEVKYCAALTIGGTNGFPINVKRIKDSRLRALAAAGMLLKNWSSEDLVQCIGNLESHASTVLIATLENPEWGPDDLYLLESIERMEGMRTLALKGGRTL